MQKTPVFAFAAGLIALVAFAVPSAAARHLVAASQGQPAPGTGQRPTGENGEQVASTEPGSPADTNAFAQYDNGVVAIVNDASISEYDLRQRVALFVATSGVQSSPDALKKIRSQILDQLESEQLQIQEAKRKHMTVSAPEVDKAIDKIVTDNHLNLDQLKGVLAKNGVQFSTLRAQIAAQLIWQKTVEDEFQDQINITDADIDAELARQMEGADKPHYYVGAIFLAVDTPEEDAKVQKDIGDLETQLQSGAPFQLVARQFSQSPSAASGGDLGWVHDGQLAPELNDVLRTMKPGTISQPIRSTGGYYILALKARQEAAGTKIPTVAPKAPTDAIPLARLLLPLGPTPTREAAEGALKVAMEIESRVQSCEALPQIAQKVRGSVYNNLGPMKLSTLSADMQAVLSKTQPGQAAQPFVDQVGVEMIFRCDKPEPVITAFTPPSRDQVQEELFDAQVTAFARRYMRDLRRQADVETR